MTNNPFRLAAQRCGWLTAAVGLAWLLFAGVARWLSGAAGLEGLTIAAGLSLLPGWLVFWGVAVSGQKNQPMAVLAATSVRLMFVLFGVLIMKSMRPDLGLREFHVWVIVFYGVALGLETLQLVRKPVEAVAAAAESVATGSAASSSEMASAR